MTIEQVPDTLSLSETIHQFIQNRLNDKLETLKSDDPKREELIAQHEPITWINDAARRVKQIQLVTHATKYHHPDAKGSSIYFKTGVFQCDYFVSTASIETILKPDVVGNAAALDVNKFLEVAYEGETLLSRVFRSDEALFHALPGTDAQKKSWLHSFSAITDPDDTITTHGLAKQVYFPVDNDDYVLLAPLYPTSLVHAVYEKIKDDKFGDATKSAREASKKGEYHEQGYCAYPELAIQNFGGSKPQNISKLNSNRGGTSYLLASLPPIWKYREVRPIKKEEQFWREFYHETKLSIKAIQTFLKSIHQDNDEPIRAQREDMVDEIIDQLIFHAEKYKELTAGWSSAEDCELSDAFKHWLDPDNFNDDDIEWQTKVADSFGFWFNQQLAKTKLEGFGKQEHIEWKHLLIDKFKGIMGGRDQ